MTAKIHWLFSTVVETTHKNGKVNTKNLNVVVRTDDINIRQVDLAAAQDGAMRRFVSEAPQLPGFQITDVFILGFSLMGQMTTEEFTAGIGEPTASEIN